jgi:GTPase SAR1 family protein
MNKSVKVLVIGLPRAGKTTFLAAFWHLLLSQEVANSLELTELQPSRDHLNAITTLWRQWRPLPRTTLPKERVVTINLRIPRDTDQFVLTVPDASGEAFRRIFETRRCSSDFEALASDAEAVLLFVHPAQAIPPQIIDVEVDRLSDIIDSAFPALPTENKRNAGTQTEGAERAETMGRDTQKAEVEDENSQKNEAPASGVLKWNPKYAAYQAKLVDLLQVSRNFRGTRPLRLAVIISAWDLCEPEGLAPQDWLKERLSLLYQYLHANEDICAFDVFGVSAQGAALSAPGALAETMRASDRITVVNQGKRSNDLTLPIRYAVAGHESRSA